MSDTSPPAVVEGEENFRTPLKLKNRLQGIIACTPNAAQKGSESPALKIPPSPCLMKLGFGTGVSVFLYERSPRGGENRSPWAIKKLNRRHLKNSEFSRRLEEEAKILKRLNHPNIIGFRGFKRSHDGTRVLAIENGEKSLGDILDEIHEIDDEPLEAHKISKVIECLAKALDYLHNEAKLLHGDLKAANVLVIGDFDNVKLCDFGVSIPLNDDGIADPTQQYIGTQAWSGPEVINEEDITTKTDIFALGCVIYEMIALEGPHMDKLPPLDASIEGDVSAQYDDTAFDDAMGTRPTLPSHLEFEDDSYEKILSIFYACTHEDPDKRPSAKMILESLEA